MASLQTHYLKMVQNRNGTLPALAVHMTQSNVEP